MMSDPADTKSPAGEDGILIFLLTVAFGLTAAMIGYAPVGAGIMLGGAISNLTLAALKTLRGSGS